MEHCDGAVFVSQVLCWSMEASDLSEDQKHAKLSHVGSKREESSPTEGSVELYLYKVLKQMADGFSAIRMEFRMACAASAGEGVPPKKVQDMFHSSGWTSPEGLGLSACRKILKLMNGEVQYIRESDAGRFTTKGKM
ncbi:hypothetical protein Bca52824_075439 [Brassica carinata]|uniref:Histidine kinase/HSP90-like ATPase domain-containing protein n=1 Tax=Brassica carinata TaxID=52824 RepID=A0A8X7PR85_BRACI|nr:hypothetical protein Bca52824_075439 [Brassica carinata]